MTDQHKWTPVDTPPPCGARHSVMSGWSENVHVLLESGKTTVAAYSSTTQEWHSFGSLDIIGDPPVGWARQGVVIDAEAAVVTAVADGVPRLETELRGLLAPASDRVAMDYRFLLEGMVERGMIAKLCCQGGLPKYTSMIWHGVPVPRHEPPADDDDGTDGAHPAWWRGNDAGVARACQRVLEFMQATPPAGACQEPLANVAAQVRALVDENAHLRAEVARLQQANLRGTP